jgi:hypothetical protein
MALTKYVVQRIPIEHEPGEWVELRMPSHKMIAQAMEARRLAALRESVATRQAVGPQVMQEWQQEREMARDAAIARGEDPDAKALARAQDADPLEKYDRTALLRAGIAAWSYTTPDGRPEPITEEAIDELDEYTSRWIALKLATFAESGFSPAPVVDEGSGYVVDTTAHPLDDRSPRTTGSREPDPLPLS